jgi:lipoprotein-anchoring transpeptidase ErfK/SrfK
MNSSRGAKRRWRRAIWTALLTVYFTTGGVQLPLAKAYFLPEDNASQAQVKIKPKPRKTAIAGKQKFKRGKLVQFGSEKPAGTIIINTQSKSLYYVLGSGQAMMYRIATAKPGFEWSGAHKVSGKKAWPDWRPPEEMRKRRPDLPTFMEGGPENPLGARAIYLGSSIYRIHGTNEPQSIGTAASSGCIRMLNQDVEELYQNVRIGASVIVM